MSIFSFWLTDKISNILDVAASTKHLAHGHTAYMVVFLLCREQKCLGSHCFVDWQREAHGRQTHNQRPKQGVSLTLSILGRVPPAARAAPRSAETNRAVHRVSCAASGHALTHHFPWLFPSSFASFNHGRDPAPRKEFLELSLSSLGWLNCSIPLDPSTVLLCAPGPPSDGGKR